MSDLARKIGLRVEIEDAGSVMQEFRSIEDVDFREGVTVDYDVERMIGTAEIRVARQGVKLSDGVTVSLSPLMDSSPANDGGALIAGAREVSIELANVLATEAIEEADYTSVFEGTIDDVEFGSETIVLTCRDKAALLHDTWLETVETYGDNDTPVAIETVMQNILDAAFGNGVITLNTIGDPDFAIVETPIGLTSVADALTSLRDLIGWDLRYRLISGTWTLTFQEPTTPGTPTRTIDSDDYYVIPQAMLSTAPIRNAVEVAFRLADGSEDTVKVTDATSISAFRRRFMRHDVRENPNIIGTTAATALANAILRDTAQPPFTHHAEELLAPTLDLHDLTRYTANGVHYDTNQDLSVTGYTHVVSGDQVGTLVRTRGTASGGWQRWIGKSQTDTRRKKDNEDGPRLDGGKLEDGSVTEPKVADDAISTGKVQDSAVTPAKLVESARGWTTSVVFSPHSSTPATRAEWDAGSLTLADGTTHSISAGATTAQAAGTTVYVYWDADTSTTALQESTTFGDAVGSRKILIAIVDVPSAGEVSIQPLRGLARLNADRIFATELSAIVANLGTVTAGTVDANVVVAAESFTAATPVFTGTLNIQTGEGSSRLFANASSGAGAWFFRGDDGVNAGVVFGSISTLSTYADAFTVRADTGNSLRLEGADEIIAEGDWGYDPKDYATSGGTENNIGLPARTSYLRVTGSSAVTFTGFQGGFVGRQLYVQNAMGSAVNVVFAHDSSSSSSGNRFKLKGDTDLTLPQTRAALFVYNGVHWLHIGDAI